MNQNILQPFYRHGYSISCNYNKLLGLDIHENDIHENIIEYSRMYLWVYDSSLRKTICSSFLIHYIFDYIDGYVLE